MKRFSKTTSHLFRLLAVTFLFLVAAQVAMGQEKRECSMGVVLWRDAATYTNVKDSLDPNQIDALPVPTTSIGCVRVTQATVLIIFQFAKGRPSNFIAIPAGSVVEVAPLVTPAKEGNKE